MHMKNWKYIRYFPQFSTCLSVYQLVRLIAGTALAIHMNDLELKKKKTFIQIEKNNEIVHNILFESNKIYGGWGQIAININNYTILYIYEYFHINKNIAFLHCFRRISNT